MRVGVIGPTGKDRFADNIADALCEMGHQVTRLGPVHRTHRSSRVQNAANLARMAVPDIDEKAQRRIAHRSLDAECEVVINIDLRLMPSTVERIRQGGARVAFWFPDAVVNLGRQLMVLSSYDALFFKEPHVVERLRANLDMPVFYLPEACNPRWHRPLNTAATEPYLVVAGNAYPVRVRLLDRLMAKGVPLKLYGAGIPSWLGDTPTRNAHVGRYITREEKARVFRSAAGVLNTMHPGEVSGVNVRLFEAAGCGAAVLTEFRPTVPELFDIGKEVLAFSNFDELVGQANRLLTEVGLSGQLGDSATRRAHREHTYAHRLSQMLGKLLS